MAPNNKIPANAVLETITPEIAYELLLTSKGNRNQRPDKVAKLMASMKEGTFVPNNDAICIDWNGVLINGHHRCTACVLSGVTVQMYVIRGMDPEAVKTMDQNARRSLADQLRMDGVDNSTQRSAIISMVARIIVGVPIEFSDDSEYYEWVTPVEKGFNTYFELGCAQNCAFMRTAKVAAPLIMAYKADPEKVTEFLISLRDGTNLKPKSAVLALREFLIEEFRTRKTQRSTPDTIIGKVFSAVKRHLDGSPVVKIQDSNVAEDYFRKLYARGSVATMAKDAKTNRNLAKAAHSLLNSSPLHSGLPEETKKMNIEDVRKHLGITT